MEGFGNALSHYGNGNYTGESIPSYVKCIFLVSLRYRSTKARVARIKRPSKRPNLVMYWPQKLAQLMLPSPVEVNICRSSPLKPLVKGNTTFEVS